MLPACPDRLRSEAATPETDSQCVSTETRPQGVWASRQTPQCSGDPASAGSVGGGRVEMGGGEAEWAVLSEAWKGELELELRGSCNPLGAVSSWLSESLSHRKRQRQEGRRGLGWEGAGRSSETGLQPARTKEETRETESALPGPVPLSSCSSLPARGCPSFCRGAAPVVLLPLSTLR